MKSRILSSAALVFLLGSCAKDDAERAKFEEEGVPIDNPSPQPAPMSMDTIFPETAVVSDPTYKKFGGADTLRKPVVFDTTAPPDSTHE